MKLDEVFILFIYSYILVKILKYNSYIISKVKRVNKKELQDILLYENSFIEVYTFLALLGVLFFYWYLSTNSYIVFFIQSFILVFSLSTMKQHILIQLSKKV
jgi:hypothetical protein